MFNKINGDSAQMWAAVYQYCVWYNVWTLQPGRAHSWQPGRRAAWRARQLERRDRGRRSNLASAPGTQRKKKRRKRGKEMEQQWQTVTDKWTDRQTDRNVQCVREQGVMSQQSGNVSFAPQEGSVLHRTLTVNSAVLWYANATIHKRSVSQCLLLKHTWLGPKTSLAM